MIGAIAGDIIGSRYEFNNIDTTEFDLFHISSTFTDDTVLTVATADAILNDSSKDYLRKYQWYFFEYPNRGWGGMFAQIASTGNLGPYNSYGNGSAMRVSPVGWICDTIDEVMLEAANTAVVTHNHEEGIKGAQATALAVHLARNGFNKEEIKHIITSRIGYDLTKPYTEYGRDFDETCQGAVPKALAIFFGTNSFEESIRQSIALGGDVDTIACIVGGISQAYYGMPDMEIVKNVYIKLPNQMRRIVTDFTTRYIDPNFVAPTEEMSQEEKTVDAMRSIFSN